MDITYDYYRIFYYVAKYKSFTRAASILMNNQPNITRSMNNLERQLGCSLFIRSNRGVELTPEGQKLYEHVTVAFEQLQAAELELANGNNLESGTVTVSASETALHGVLLPVLRSFHTSYPGIRIRISNHSTSQAVQAVKNGLVDFAAVTTPTDVSRPLKEIKLKEFHEVLVCGRRYSFLAKDTQHLSGLKDYPLISLGKETKTYELYTSLYLKYGLVMSPDIEVATADQLIPTILHDLGIGFVPEPFVKNHTGKEPLYVIPLAEDIPSRSICLVEDTSRPLSIAANTLKNMLKTFC
ncbi:MAG: LysR family transcriptional regulator [Clostridiales bacterium]|nr:LysR family transcriptional regulator [Clostridiales bacterium]